MAISSPGIGSGLDVNSIVSQLVALERRPIAGLQSKASSIQTQISAYGKVQSLVTGLRDAAAALAKPTLWQQTTASSSDATAVKASATGSPAAGSYTVQVNELAAAHSLATSAFTSEPATVGEGKLTIRWAAGDFGSSSDELALEFTDPATTLEQVRDAINSAGGGVRASIVRDANGARLALTSNQTGTASALRVTATDSDGTPLTSGLSALAYPPNAGASGMVETQPAANALFTVNGLALESASNQVTGAVDGLSITLAKKGGGPITLTVVNDVDGQRKAVQDFVTAYNAVNSYLADQTKYDESSKAAGSLQGDSAAVSLRNQLRGLLRESNGASTALTQLSQIGFDVQRDGSIKLNASKLDAALAQPAELKKLLANVDLADSSRVGLATRFRELGDQLTRSDGVLTTRNEGLQGRLKRNKSEQERVNERVERTRERLLRQYQTLDTKLGQLNNLSTYVTQQMNMLNKQFTNDR